MSEEKVVSIRDYVMDKHLAKNFTKEEELANLIQQQMYNIADFAEKAEELSKEIDSDSVERKISNSMQYAIQFIKCAKDLKQQLDHKQKI